MLWYRDFGVIELLFILLFGVLYVAYLWRIIRVAHTLKTPYYNVFVKLILRTLAFGCLIIAFLGPSFGESKKEVKSVGKDIMICVDLSKSMDAFDIQPTRIEKVKYEMKKIVDAFNSDRIGIVIFSSEAFMQCPLTYDQNALHLFIEAMSTNLVPASGTDFTPPLKLALNKLEDDDGAPTETKSKVVILISDGEDFGEDRNDIAQEIENKGIKLFTLGVGTEQGGKIYNGNKLKTDNSGNVVVSKLNSSALKSMATKTGGQFFEINETRNDVSRLINTIGGIEGQLREARFVDVTANKYFYFLGIALLLLALDVLINIKTIRI